MKIKDMTEKELLKEIKKIKGIDKEKTIVFYKDAVGNVHYYEK
jgi:hypothetical protein